MNPFNPNDLVKYPAKERKAGKVLATGCIDCPPGHCQHPKENHSKVWVQWPDVQTIMRYDWQVLEIDNDKVLDTLPSPKVIKEPMINFDQYNGFRKQSQEKCNQIKDEQLDFSAYNGFARRKSYRKGN